MTSATRPATWPAGLMVIGVAVAAALFIRAEAQWEVATLVAIAGGLSLLLGRSQWRGRLDTAWHARPRRLGWLALAASLAVVALFAEDHFALLMISTVLLYGVACLGLTVQFGYAGVVNFAGAAFFGIGSYTAAVLGARNGVPPVLAVIAGGALAGLVGSVLVLPLLRTRGHYAALITIAFGLLFRTFVEVSDVLGGPQGLKVEGLSLFGWRFNDNIELGEDIELSFYLNYALASLLLFVGAFSLVRRLDRSWLGLSLDAVRLDETSAAAFGFDVARWKILAFMLGNVLAGLAGAVYGQMTGFVAP